jgi:hypothetical protein
MSTTLQEALREVMSTAAASGDPARVRQVEELTEEVRRFQHDFGPLIEEALSVQRYLRQHPDFRDLPPLRFGADGEIGPEMVERAERLIQVPEVAALGSSAARQGCKGMGLITANAEAAVIIGGQAGAEAIWLWPYKVGTFRSPNRLVGRAWYEETIGIDIGASATVAPVPLDLSFWFLPPEKTSLLVGAYLGYEGPPMGPILLPFLFAGVRVEVIGWLPPVTPPRSDSAALPTEPESIIKDAFQYIAGFRIYAELGLHLGIGVVRKGHQVASDSGIELATYYLTPTNLVAGMPYDGSNPAYAPIQGTISHPVRDKTPSKEFQTGDTPTTLALNFPSWMCTGMSAAPTLTFGDDGSGNTTGWQLTSTPTAADPTFTYQWAGTAGQAWQQDITFQVTAGSAGAPPQTGQATYLMKGLVDTLAKVNIPVSSGDCAMTLSAQVFTATGTYALTVDTSVNPIEDYSGTSVTGPLTATNADADHTTNPNNFYYLPDPTDSTKQLIIDYPKAVAPNGPTPGKSWYVGYQFQQQGSSDNAAFRAVFWEVGQPFTERNLYCDIWHNLTGSGPYTSTATWSDGAISNSATLSITLTADSGS